jgi:hypothetical protein
MVFAASACELPGSVEHIHKEATPFRLGVSLRSVRYQVAGEGPIASDARWPFALG